MLLVAYVCVQNINETAADDSSIPPSTPFDSCHNFYCVYFNTHKLNESENENEKEKSRCECFTLAFNSICTISVQAQHAIEK